MAQDSPDSIEDHSNTFAGMLEPKRHEVWWYRQGAYLATAIAAAVIWFVMIGPKQISPKTEFVDPATEALAAGIVHPLDLASLSKQLKFKVTAPDLKQLGGKLTKVGKCDFAGQKAAVLQYQYGKSIFHLYRFSNASVEMTKMKQLRSRQGLFYYSSAGAVSVVTWKDRLAGYDALAAKATETDLLRLAGKLSSAER